MSTSHRLLSAALLVAVGCGPSAKVTRTTPVADLQSYGVVAVRADGNVSGDLVQQLESSTIQQLAQRCQFSAVLPAAQMGQNKPDLVLDLNLQRTFRGGTGFIKNQNKATVEVLAVLSDGVSDDLLGSAWIQGESSSVMVSGVSPEGQAVDAVAKKIAQVLGNSGCKGPRVARAEPPPENGDTGSAGDTGDSGNAGDTGDSGNAGDTGDSGNAGDTGDAAKKEGAEALNDAGKAAFKKADMTTAAAKFQAAGDLYPDPRYDFNLCMTYEALKRYDEAIATCQKVIDKQPEQRLIDKAKDRIEIIQQLEQGK